MEATTDLPVAAFRGDVAEAASRGPGLVDEVTPAATFLASVDEELGVAAEAPRPPMLKECYNNGGSW